MLAPRVFGFLAIIILLIGLAYAGYVNELLKDTVAPWHRGLLVVGFIVGVGAVSRHLTRTGVIRRETAKDRS